MSHYSRSICLFGVRSPLIDDYLESCQRLTLSIEFAIQVDDEKPRISQQQPVIRLQDLNATDQHSPFVAPAFSPERRKELVKLAINHQFEAAEALIDPTSVVASSTKIGRGSYINAMTVIASVSRIGEHVFINRACNLGHHTMVGDFTSFGPGVTAASNIRIGEHAVIGAGAVLLPGVTIGNGAVVSAGTRVDQNVPDNHLAIGHLPTIKPIQPHSKLAYYHGQE